MNSKYKTAYKSTSELKESRNLINVVQPIPDTSFAVPLIGFSVTVDSVVATADIIVDDQHTKLSINWGDTIVEHIDLVKLRQWPTSQAINPSGTPNTLKIQHVYLSPFDDGLRVVEAVTEEADGSRFSSSETIEIIKRYKFSFYSLILEFPHHLDSIFENDSEIEVRVEAKSADTSLLKRSWKESVTTNPDIVTPNIPIEWRLDNSHFSTEQTLSDEAIVFDLHIEDADGIGKEGGILNTIWDIITSPKYIYVLVAVSNNPAYDQYDLENLTDENPITFHPNKDLNTSLKSAVFRMPADRGVIFLRFNYEFELIKPIDQNVQKAFVT